MREQPMLRRNAGIVVCGRDIAWVMRYVLHVDVVGWDGIGVVEVVVGIGIEIGVLLHAGFGLMGGGVRGIGGGGGCGVRGRGLVETETDSCDEGDEEEQSAGGGGRGVSE